MSNFTSFNGYDVEDSKARIYPNVDGMKSISNLVNGDIIRTAGYYTTGDGGSATYLIRAKTETDNEDGGLIHFLQNELVAELIIEDTINVKQFGAYGNGSNDDTLAIQKAINSSNSVFLPSGTYKITSALSIPTGKTIFGVNKYYTTINCYDCDGIHFEENAERGNFKGIRFLGGSFNHHVFVFNKNVVCWNFDDIWIRSFGDSYFYANGNGHVNNIIIQNSQFESGGKHCVEFLTSADSQINAVTIKNCNISGFTNNGVLITGNNINISGCTIQNCEFGISLDPSTKKGTNNYCQSKGINITSNYFEMIKKSFINICPYYDTSINGFMSAIVITGNYGAYYNECDLTYPAIRFNFNASRMYRDSECYGGSVIAGVFYAGNHFQITKNRQTLIDGGYILQHDSIIFNDGTLGNNISDESNPKPILINMNNANIFDKYNKRIKVIKAYTGNLKNATDITAESVNISSGGSALLNIPDIEAIVDLKVKVASDNITHYSLLELYGYKKSDGSRTKLFEKYFRATSEEETETIINIDGRIGLTDKETTKSIESFELVYTANNANIRVDNVLVTYLR